MSRRQLHLLAPRRRGLYRRTAEGTPNTPMLDLLDRRKTGGIG